MLILINIDTNNKISTKNTKLNNHHPLPDLSKHLLQLLDVVGGDASALDDTPNLVQVLLHYTELLVEGPRGAL